MEARLNGATVAPGDYRAMLGLESYVNASGLQRSLLDLVRLRASQINGCAYCVDMHSKDARAEGETEQRLYGLTAWREMPVYSERERAALAWTEAVCVITGRERTAKGPHMTWRSFLARRASPCRRRCHDVQHRTSPTCRASRH